MCGSNRLGIKEAMASLIAAGALCTSGLGQGFPACDDPDPKAGDCFTATPGIPGCQEEVCCNLVCDVDQFCCVIEWDQNCVDIAIGVCLGDCDTCGLPNCGDCFVDHGGGDPFCNDQCTGQECAGCCLTICAFDPYCCGTDWDEFCVAEAEEFCLCKPDQIPVNDDCENAIEIAEGVFDFTTICATHDGSDPMDGPCWDGFTGIAADVWFHYTASITGPVRVHTCGGQADFDSKLAVYAGCVCPLTKDMLIECNDNGCGDGSEVIFEVVAGNCYTIRLGGGYLSPSGSGTFTIEPIGPPANDDCANAIALNVNESLVFNTLVATTDGLPSAVCDFNGFTDIANDVWYHTTVPEDSSYIVSLCDSSFDTKVAIYEGCGECPPTNDPIACNDDFCDVQSQVVFNGTANQCYLIRIGNPAAPGAGGAGGSGRVILSRLLPAPDNIIYDNGAPDGTSGLSNGVADRELADDFSLEPCPDGWSVTGARLSGVWAGGGAFGLTTGFRIRVYDDAGGIPADTPNIDFMTTTFVEALTGSFFFGDPEILFDIEFPAITLDAEITQWISIQPLEVDDNLFHLTSATGIDNITGSEVHVRYPDLGFPDWTPGSEPKLFNEFFDVTYLLLGNDCGAPPCPWDLSGDGIVGAADLLVLLTQWGGPGSADFDGDGNVGAEDLLVMLVNWGPCP